MMRIFRKEAKSVDDLFMSVASGTKINYRAANKKIWVESFVIFGTFAITFMLYPSIVFQKSNKIIAGRSDWSIFILNVS